MRQYFLCPICSCDKTSVVAFLNEIKLKKLVNFSARKYKGYLEKLIEDVPPIIRLCKGCGHFWYQNQPNKRQLKTLYEVSQPLKKSAINHEPTQAMIKSMKKFMSLVRINQRQKEVSLLDFGSGFGRWSRAASAVGFKVLSFEPSLNRGFQENTPYRLVHADKQFKNKKFDSILLEQVLEHVPEPVEILKQLRNNCHSRTIIKIAVPNIQRNKDGKEIWNTWPYNGKSPHILAPYEHLHGFCSKSIDLMIKKAGFKNLGLYQELRHTKTNMLRRLLGEIIPPVSSTIRYVTRQ